jgi:FHS family glucose/mannose:H+ symporter-like MFS transporter
MLGNRMVGAEAKNPENGTGAVPPALLVAFVAAGIATTMVGPLLPGLESRWHIKDAAASLLFTALFLGTVSTGALVGPLASRFGLLSLVRSGLVLTGLGAALLAISPWPQAVGAVAMVGCGLGLSIPAGNLAVAGPRAVMSVNLAWSIGAVGGPLLLASFPKAFLWCLSVALVCVSMGAFGAPARIAEPEASHSNAVTSKAAVLTAFFVFLYVGVESSLDGWLSSYAARNSETLNLWAVSPAIFWLSILVGRFSATIALRRISPGSVLYVCLVAAFSGACLLLTAIRPWAILAATALCGLGLAPVFPLAVSSYADLTRGKKSAGLIFSAGGLGGASIPALVGSVSEAFVSLRFAMAIAPVLIAAMFFLWLSIGTGRHAD